MWTVWRCGATDPASLDRVAALTTGASIGVRILSDDVDAARVLADADLAMYQAKSAGRGQTWIFGRC